MKFFFDLCLRLSHSINPKDLIRREKFSKEKIKDDLKK